MLQIHKSVLYVRLGECQDMPLPLVVVAGDELDFQAARQAAADVGALDDFERYHRKAVGYFVMDGDSPVGVGWRFRHSSLLWRVGCRNGIYLGGFLVTESHRRKGIYANLLRYLCALPECREHRVFAQADVRNMPSQRGLEKAGFERAGIVEAVMWRGIALRIRLQTADRRP